MISPDQLRAIEYVFLYGDSVITGIKELRHSFEPNMPGIKESKDLYEEARRNVQLAKDLLRVHGRKSAPGELAARLNCTIMEAEYIITKLEVKANEDQGDKPFIEQWNSKDALKWLRRYAASAASEAKYIRSNAEEWASNEDEFRCGLANGLGIEGEDQDEIIRKIHGIQTEKKPKFKLETSHLKEVEHSLKVPMRHAVTLPVLNESGDETGVIIYVCSSAFDFMKRATPAQVQKIAKLVADNFS